MINEFLASAKYAWEGISYAFRTQRHMKYHVAIAVLACVLGFIAGLEFTEWSLIIIMIALVMSLEIMNTAVERVVDLASPDVHPLAKAAKDAAAGAVLLAATASVVVGLLIIGPPLWSLLVNG